MPRKKKPSGDRKLGNHTEENMRKAIELIKSGWSIRQASIQCLLSYATVRRYLVLTKKSQGKEVRLTPNYEVNRIFTGAEENCLAKYVKYITKQFEDISSKDCRRIAYEMGCFIGKKIPKRWTQDQKAGVEWFRSFKSRHPGISVRKHRAGDLARETVFDKQDMEVFFGHLVVKKDKVSEQEAQPGPSKILDTTTPLDSSGKEQDPLSRVIEQCRFCGEFSKDCVAVSSDMTYLAGNKTTLALNDTSVQLDFNDASRPKTVCRDCDAKLQEFCDFVNVVKAAQGTLINVAEEKEDIETTADVEENAEYEETETLIVKTEYDSQPEDSDDDKEGIVDSITVGETVFVKGAPKRKSDTDTAKPKKLKTKEKCDDDIVIDIKEEVIEKEADDGHGLSEVSDTGTGVKPSGPSELELATSALVFEMAGDGTSECQVYRSDR